MSAALLPPDPPKPFIPDTDVGFAALQILNRIKAGMKPLANDATEMHQIATMRIHTFWRSKGWYWGTWHRIVRFGAEFVSSEIEKGFRNAEIDLL